jgi:hypothetical protein
MGVGVPMTTRSEAIQVIQRSEDCPYLLDCGIPVTKNFFNCLCNSSRYTDCHHFARRAGELQAPLVWLQRRAMHEEGRKAPSDGEGVLLTEASR